MSNKYIVRYGVMRLMGLFTGPGETRFNRGARVVIRTDRGLEAGEVLAELGLDLVEGHELGVRARIDADDAERILGLDHVADLAGRHGEDHFLDRQVLSVLAPALTAEFHMSNTVYARVVFAFQLSYTVMFSLGGFGLVLDGSERVDGIIRSAVEWDVVGGLARRHYARHVHACAQRADHSCCASCSCRPALHRYRSGCLARFRLARARCVLLRRSSG